MKEQNIKNKVVVAAGAISLIAFGMAIQRYKNSIKFTLINFACRFPIIGNWLAERHKDNFKNDTPRRRHSDSSFVTINLDSPYTTPRDIDTPRDEIRVHWRDRAEDAMRTRLSPISLDQNT